MCTSLFFKGQKLRVFVDSILILRLNITHHLFAFSIEHKILIITAGLAVVVNRAVIFISNKNAIVPVAISNFVNIRCDIVHINFHAIKVRFGFLKK